NALSAVCHVTVCVGGKMFEQEYHRGIPQYAVREIGVADTTGTTVYFKPDNEIFKETTYNREILAGRLRELAYLNRKISITLTDEREKDDAGNALSETFYSEGGITEFVQMLDRNGRRNALLPAPIFIEAHDAASNVAVEVAMVYNDSF